MSNLEKIFSSDKQGLPKDSRFKEQINSDTAIFCYYGLGDIHEAKYQYTENGWKFIEYYDRQWELLSEKEKKDLLISIVKELNELELNKITILDGSISFEKH